MSFRSGNVARVIVVGVDENGLGPLLGPLVATAVTIEVDSYDAAKLRRRGLRLGIHDSKQTSGFGHMAWTEALSLALLERLTGHLPESFDDLLAAVSLDPVATLREPCPESTRAQCWSADLVLPVFDGDIEAGRLALQKLSRSGVEVTRARSALACAGVLNRAFASGGTRVSTDLGLFERLLLDVRAQQSTDVLALCGMVGGIRDYPAYFTHFPVHSVAEAKHSKRVRAYNVQGLGDVRFVIDGDALHLPVGLASMIGKYVRELAMERHNRFYRTQDPSLTTGSGYHDPVTKRFVAASAPLRRKLGLVDACFRR